MKVTIIDSRNMNYTVSKRYPGFKLNYKIVEDKRKIVVGQMLNTEAHENFVNILRMLGYITTFPMTMIQSNNELLARTIQNSETTILLVCEIMRVMNKVESITIGSQDKVLCPIVRQLRAQGIFVEIFGAGIPRELRIVSNLWTEIRPEHLIKSNQN